jgi:hypothetical protein
MSSSNDPRSLKFSSRRTASCSSRGYSLIIDDDAISTLVKRLSRPDGSGGAVIERAAIMAEGPNSVAILAWIAAHDGQPEAATPTTSMQGLHSARLSDTGGVGSSPPRRYVLPRGALS